MQAAAPTLGKNHEVTDGLRFRQLTQACRRHVLKRDVLRLVSGHKKVHARIRAALLQLARRVHVARAYFEARHDLARFRDLAADTPERLAAGVTVERQKRVHGEIVARLNRGEQAVERRANIGCRRAAIRYTHLDVAEVGRALVDEIGLGEPFGQQIEHLRLHRCHIGLVERGHLHEVAEHGRCVFPHHEVISQLPDVADGEIETWKGRVETAEATREIVFFIPRARRAAVRDDRAILAVESEQQRVRLELR